MGETRQRVDRAQVSLIAAVAAFRDIDDLQAQRPAELRRESLFPLQTVADRGRARSPRCAAPAASMRGAEAGTRVRRHGARTTRGWRSPRTSEGQRRARRSRVRRSAEASMRAYQPPGMRPDICDRDEVLI